MSDKLVGDLTNEHQRIEGSLVSTDVQISGSLSPKTRTLSGELDGHGTRNYNRLYNKPKIEGVTLEGDKTFEDLNLRSITNAELAELLK